MLKFWVESKKTSKLNRYLQKFYLLEVYNVSLIAQLAFSCILNEDFVCVCVCVKKWVEGDD